MAAVLAQYFILIMQAPWKMSSHPTYAHMDMQMTMA